MKKNPLKLSPIQIIKRGNWLYHFSFWIYGLYYDLKFAGRSLNGTVFNDIDGAYPAQNLSYIYLNELVKVIDCNPDDVFVDVGCAWGRLIAFLRKKTKIKSFIGVEINQKIAERAQHCFRNDSDIKIINGDIIETFPDDGTVFFLFNPFDENYLSQFLDRAESLAKHKIKLLYLYPTCREVIDKRLRWKLVKQIQLKPKHMGALDLCIYEFDV